jgi:hypothetical protein
MATFPMAGLVAGHEKTASPTYMEGHRKDPHRTGAGFLLSIECFHPVERDQSENRKAELTMKKYSKPMLKCLGLLRLVTKFSF